MDKFIQHLQQNFEQDDTRVAVRFTDDVSKEGRRALAPQLGLLSEEVIPLRTRKYTLFAVKSAEEDFESVANNAAREKVVSFFKRMFYRSKINANQSLVILPEVIVYGAGETIEAAAKLVGGNVQKRADHRDGESAVIVLPIAGDLSEAVNCISEKYPELIPVPNTMSIIKRQPLETTPSEEATPGSSQHDNEWYHRIIQAPEAWKLAEGNKSIKIAILDEGVDMKHEDLKDAIIAEEAFDAIGNDGDPSPSGDDAHGTACAGLAAGINNNIGVRGIGSGCSIVPIRIAYSKYYPQERERRWYITNSAIAKSFEHCVRVHAHVVSNSWGGDFDEGYKESLQKAINAGLIVVGAAGNESSTPVLYPARSKGVICVSASNNLDNAKKINDNSFENWWGTNYGKEVWIAAPGVQMFTTDISGPHGNDPGRYTSSFNGTSSATPVVAGAIGLMLSVNPNLTPQQVKDILRDTAEKKGTDGYDLNGRNDYMGYGRLNVLKAVQAAKALLPPSI